MDFLAMVTMAFLAGDVTQVPANSFQALGVSRASPQPTLMTTLSILGICMVDL